MAELRQSLEDRITALDEASDVDELAGILRDLPSEKDREWELALTRIVEVAPEQHENLKSLMDAREDAAVSESVRFAAFFAYCTRLRRRGNVSDFKDALDAYDKFADHPMYPHLQALHAKGLRAVGGYDDAIKYAEEAQQRVGRDHSGVNHSYVTSIVRIYEDGYGDLLDKDRENALNEAAATLEQIMDEPVYPKFKVTFGRIKALQGEYDEALKLIQEGIDLEDDTKADYALRVSSYRTHEQRVYLNKYIDSIEASQDDLEETVSTAITDIENIREESEDQVRELQGQTLQFLGFFATLLAVIISTVTISLEFSLLPAASLITVLVGGLMLAFGGLTVMLPVEQAIKKGVVLALIGFTTLGAGFGMVAVVSGVL